MPSAFHKLSLYASVAALNLAVGALFISVNIKPPVPPPIPIAVANPKPRPAPTKQGIPNRIVIPSLNIDIPVAIGSYNAANNSWAIDAQHAYFAEPSTPVNNKSGNTLIYGHRLPNIFAHLSLLQPKDQVIVYTDSGYVFHYEYQSRLQVEPTDVSLFSSSGPPTLILQTCSGSWDQYRTLFSLSLAEVSKA